MIIKAEISMNYINRYFNKLKKYITVIDGITIYYCDRKEVSKMLIETKKTLVIFLINMNM